YHRVWEGSCDWLLFFFFFQAEDGIRDFHVTGVQTCALPICSGGVRIRIGSPIYSLYLLYIGLPILMRTPPERAVPYILAVIVCEIGRASRREGVKVSEGGRAVNRSREQRSGGLVGAGAHTAM